MNKISCSMKTVFERTLILFVIIAAIVFISCSSSKDYNTMDVEQLFNAGMKNFQKEDWLEAQNIFDLVKLQHPSSQYADDAQYYMAESYFKQKKYILAAYNYNTLRRFYPTSEYAKVSLFKNGMCYKELSLPFDRDQDYTEKAITAFLEFKYAYPEDSLAREADVYLKEMRNKLGNKAFFTAELYRKLYSPESALIYYDIVINEYADTDFYQPSYVGKIEVLSELKRYDEALSIAHLYFNKFADGKFISKIKQLEKEISSLKDLYYKDE